MAGYLRSADMAAIDAMEHLRDRFGNAAGIRLQPIDDAIADIDFDTALQLCEDMLAALGARVAQDIAAIAHE